MADFSARRVVAVAAAAGALVGGAVAGGVAEASANDNPSSHGSAAAGGSVTTAAVVRTTLVSTAQVGGSIGFEGSYTVVGPSGTSAQQLAQAQQAVTMDEQALSADEQAEVDAAAADDQAIAADQANATTVRSTLGSDQATQTIACAGPGASTPACSADTQKVAQDQSQLSQADQQLANAQSTATRDHDQNEARILADQTKLAGDQTTLASLRATALNPGSIYTSLPHAGDVIKEDQPVYSLSDVPVPLLYGSIAAYRAFYVGMADGADVGQLTADLISLGYGAGLTRSNHYSTGTAAAVERWERALGLPATGQILLGQVVFEPGPIRVTSVTPSVGQAPAGGGGASGGGTVLTATGTTPVVTVDLDVTEEYLVKPEDAVTVVLPDGTSTVGGHVEKVGAVAACPGGGSTGNGSGSADQSPCSSAGSNNNSTPTVTVTIGLDQIPPGATLDQAPVNVDITTQQAKDVLAVPVNALLALEGGGFGVDVVSGGTSRLVGVTTGMYSNTLVEITGQGIAVGTRVEVPAS